MGILTRLRNKLKVVGGGQPQAPTRVKREPPPPPSHPQPDPEEEFGAASPRGDEDPLLFIERIVKENRLVLFMKGTPSAPQCGFSANAVGVLSGFDVDPYTFDVLSDPDVRESVKQYSSWPTIPQVYIDGNFVGGSDILMQLHESGELATLMAGAD